MQPGAINLQAVVNDPPKRLVPQFYKNRVNSHHDTIHDHREHQSDGADSNSVTPAREARKANRLV